jgi:alkylated DNA repair dioxygenase AlkB
LACERVFGSLGCVPTHQRSLFAFGPLGIDDAVPVRRIALDDASWVDLRRDWVRGSDALLDHLVDTVAWRQGRRPMYDRVLDDPRLSCWYREGEPGPHPFLEQVSSAIARDYAVPLRSLGLNYYRDGADSVAFHADRELREVDDTLIAILTLGVRRPFLVRPKGGGRSVDLAPAGGDLLVMGGACQRGFEHGVPKIARAGPRISCTWRWAAGRPAA